MKLTIEDVTVADLEKMVASLKPNPLAVVSSGLLPPIPTDTQTLLRRLSPIFHAATNGQKILAIKELRLLTGCGLTEAKDVVEGNFY